MRFTTGEALTFRVRFTNILTEKLHSPLSSQPIISGEALSLEKVSSIPSSIFFYKSFRSGVGLPLFITLCFEKSAFESQVLLIVLAKLSSATHLDLSLRT